MSAGKTMTRTEAELNKLRDELAGQYECSVQDNKRQYNENNYKYRDFLAGFDAAIKIAADSAVPLDDIRELTEVLEKWKILDVIKYDLDSSVYTLEDNEFETVFFVRDMMNEALKKFKEKHGGKL